MSAPMIHRPTVEHPTRAELEVAIAHIKAKHDRLPKHFEDKRAELMDEIEALVDDWIAASG